MSAQPAVDRDALLGLAEDTRRPHGNEKRLSIGNLKLAMRILYATVRDICG